MINSLIELVIENKEELKNINKYRFVKGVDDEEMYSNNDKQLRYVMID